MKYGIVIKIIIGIYFFLFIHLENIFAATVTLSDFTPDTISDANQEIQVKTVVSIKTGDNTNYYLRGVFFKPGTSNYCGYTWNDKEWYNGPFLANDGFKKLAKVTISSNSAEIQLKVKVDITDSGCKESGLYGFKVQRYTESGSANFDDQNEQNIQINIPTDSPVPSYHPSNTQTPTVRPTDKPVNSKAVKPSATTVLYRESEKPAFNIIPSQKDAEPRNTNIQENILGEQEENKPTLIQGIKSKANQNGNIILILILIVAGIICLTVSVYISIRNIRNRNN